MSLRTIKALKYFAILIFSFEILAPAMFASSIPSQNERIPSETSLNKTGHFSNVFSTLLCEENNGEEEERSRDHRAVFPLSDFGFVQVFACLSQYEFQSIRYFIPKEAPTSPRSVVTLLHCYVI